MSNIAAMNKKSCKSRFSIGVNDTQSTRLSCWLLEEIKALQSDLAHEKTWYVEQVLRPSGQSGIVMKIVCRTFFLWGLCACCCLWSILQLRAIWIKSVFKLRSKITCASICTVWKEMRASAGFSQDPVQVLRHNPSLFSSADVPHHPADITATPDASQMYNWQYNWAADRAFTTFQTFPPVAAGWHHHS